MFFNLLKKIIEQKFSIGRSTGGFGVKLHGKEWFGIMLNSFAGSIVGVFEEDAPLLAEGGSVDGKTMVL